MSSDSRAIVYDPRTMLRDRHFILQALMEALAEGDTEAFKEILEGHLRATKKDDFASFAGIPRRTLFRMLSPEGNPTLESVAKVLKALSKAA